MKKVLIADDYTVWSGRVATYLTKPLDLEKVKVLVRRALEAQKLAHEVERDYMEWESLVDEHEMLLLQLRKLKGKFPSIP